MTPGSNHNEYTGAAGDDPGDWVTVTATTGGTPIPQPLTPAMFDNPVFSSFGVRPRFPSLIDTDKEELILIALAETVAFRGAKARVANRREYDARERHKIKMAA